MMNLRAPVYLTTCKTVYLPSGKPVYLPTGKPVYLPTGKTRSVYKIKSIRSMNDH
jgi:hypothetical protein